MFLAKDHAAFDTDRTRLAAWADISHLQWGFAQGREYRNLQQHGRNPAEEVVGLFYMRLRLRACRESGIVPNRSGQDTVPLTFAHISADLEI